MAITLQRWVGVCPAATATTPSPLCSPQLFGFHPYSPLLSTFVCSSSFRVPYASSSYRHDSRRRVAIDMRFGATDERPSGRTQLTVGEAERVCNSPQAHPSVTKPTLATREGSLPQKLIIPCLLMRGGTSRGTFFLQQHLPEDREALNKVLLRVMGSPDSRQIDGLGGATSVTSKVAIISASMEPGVDVEYTFAEVAVNRSYVDWEPTCGNMLAGVGPAAIEMGLVKELGNPITLVRIRATNNDALVEAVVQTPNYSVTYDGNAVVDGISGMAAPITLNFMNIMGSKTAGKLLPTGELRELIDGVEVTCIDVAMPLVIAKASSFGKTGYESIEELNNDVEFFRKMDAIRLIAGRKMGFGNVSGRVIPKFAIVASPRDIAMGDNSHCSITARYFTPLKTHPSMAVTGAICIGCCSILKGSVANEVSTTASSTSGDHNTVLIEHPSGRIQICMHTEQTPGRNGGMTVHRAGVMRTARLLFEGFLHIKMDGLEDVGLGFRKKSLDGFLNRQDHLQREFRKLYRVDGLADEPASERDGVEVTELRPSVNVALGA